MLRKILLWFLIFLHAVFLMAFTFFWVNLPITLGDESKLIQWTMIYSRLILGFDPKPAQNEWLFVNTSYSNKLIDKLDEEGFPVGNDIITDRKQLVSTLEKIDRLKNPHKFLMFDIYFDKKTEDDSLLEILFNKVPRTLASCPLNDSTGKKETLVMNIPNASSSYLTYDETFLKFTLMTDSISSVPLTIYKMISGKEFENKKWYIKDNQNNYYFNNFILDLPIRDYHIRTKYYTLVNLCDLAVLPDSIFLDFVKNRKILFGDFERGDKHLTAVGTQPGPLILANSIQNLEDQRLNITWSLVIYLFSIFLFISYIIFKFDLVLIQKISFLKQVNLYLIIVFIMTLVSFITYFLFNLHLNVLIIATYVYVLEWLTQKYKLYIDKKLAKTVTD